MNTRTGLRAAITAAVLTAVPSLATAQGGPPGPPPGGPPAPQPNERGFWPRGGLYGGLGIGAGSITFDCDFCTDEEIYEGISFHGDLGFHVNPRLGLFLDIWGIAAPGFEITDGFVVEDAFLTNTFVTVGGQIWLLPPLWLKGGLGAAQENFQSDSFDVEGDEGPAFLIAVGYEVLHSPNFSVDLGLRVGSALYDEDVGGTATNAALTVSINFHQLLPSHY